MKSEPTIKKLKQRVLLRFPDDAFVRNTDIRNMFFDIIETLETLQCDRKFCPFMLTGITKLIKEEENDKQG